MPTGYVLILLVAGFLTGNSNVSVTSQLFAGQAACNVAGKTAVNKFARLGITIDYVCVNRGNFNIDLH